MFKLYPILSIFLHVLLTNLDKTKRDNREAEIRHAKSKPLLIYNEILLAEQNQLTRSLPLST